MTTLALLLPLLAHEGPPAPGAPHVRLAPPKPAIVRPIRPPASRGLDEGRWIARPATRQDLVAVRGPYRGDKEILLAAPLPGRPAGGTR